MKDTHTDSAASILKYFEPFPDDASPEEFRLVPIDLIVPGKLEEFAGDDGLAPSVAKALGHIRNGSRRKPLDVIENGDGTFAIIDGSACYSAHRILGTPELPVRILKKL